MRGKDLCKICWDVKLGNGHEMGCKLAFYARARDSTSVMEGGWDRIMLGIWARFPGGGVSTDAMQCIAMQVYPGYEKACIR